MRILHSTIPYTFSNLQVQFHAGHGHKHPFLVIEQGEHKLHTKTERLHGELASWQGEFCLQIECNADVTAGTPFRIVVYEHHTVAPDQAIAEGTFVVTANIAGPQQCSVVLANKRGYQKGTAVFVLNIGNKTELWGSPVSSPTRASQSAFLAQGPLGLAAPLGYPASQHVALQQAYIPAQQMYASQAGPTSPTHSRVQSGSPPPQHSLLPQGRGSIVYSQGLHSQGVQQGMVSSNSSLTSAVQQGPQPQPPQCPPPYIAQSIYAQPASPCSSGGPLQQGPPALGQQFFDYIEDRPVTKEVVTYVQEHHPIAKQYVVETRFTGQEHEVPGPSQQQVVGHQERIISGASIPAPPQVVQQAAVNVNYSLQQQQPPPAKHSFFHRHHKQASSGATHRGLTSTIPAAPMQQAAVPVVGQQYFNVVEERPVVREVIDYVQERQPIAKQYVTETRFTGQEYQMQGSSQQQVVGHQERIVGAAPVNYGNNDLYM